MRFAVQFVTRRLAILAFYSRHTDGVGQKTNPGVSGPCRPHLLQIIHRNNNNSLTSFQTQDTKR